MDIQLIKKFQIQLCWLVKKRSQIFNKTIISKQNKIEKWKNTLIKIL